MQLTVPKFSKAWKLWSASLVIWSCTRCSVWPRMATFFTARMLTFGLSWLRIESESTIAESNESNESNETARSKVYGIQQIPTATTAYKAYNRNVRNKNHKTSAAICGQWLIRLFVHRSWDAVVRKGVEECLQTLKDWKRYTVGLNIDGSCRLGRSRAPWSHFLGECNLAWKPRHIAIEQPILESGNYWHTRFLDDGYMFAKQQNDLYNWTCHPAQMVFVKWLMQSCFCRQVFAIQPGCVVGGTCRSEDESKESFSCQHFWTDLNCLIECWFGFL